MLFGEVQDVWVQSQLRSTFQYMEHTVNISWFPCFTIVGSFISCLVASNHTHWLPLDPETSHYALLGPILTIFLHTSIEHALIHCWQFVIARIKMHSIQNSSINSLEVSEMLHNVVVSTKCHWTDMIRPFTLAAVCCCSSLHLPNLLLMCYIFSIVDLMCVF